MRKNDSIWIFVEIGVACCYAATLLYKLVYPEPNDRLLGVIWMVLGMIALIAPLVHLYFKLTASKIEKMAEISEKQGSVLNNDEREQSILKPSLSVPTTSSLDVPNTDVDDDCDTDDNEATTKDKASELADTTIDATIPCDAPFVDDLLSKAFFDGLVEANFLDVNYQPKSSILKSQLVYIVATISEILNINTCWSAYEKFWKMTNFRQNYNSMYKRESSVTNKEAIDQVFLRVGLNHDRIKDLRTFIRWKTNIPE